MIVLWRAARRAVPLTLCLGYRLPGTVYLDGLLCKNVDVSPRSISERGEIGQTENEGNYFSVGETIACDMLLLQ